MSELDSTKYRLNTVGKLGSGLLAEVLRAKCGDKDRRRSKRYAKLGSVTWPKDMMPISISVQNAPRGYSIQDIEEIALHCAKVSNEKNHHR